MSNYTRNTLTGDLAPVNAELEKIQASITDKLDRNPTVGQANQLDNTLDANNNRIINLPAPSSPNDPARLKDLSNSQGNSVIPPQEGQAGEFLRTDGETAFWDVVTKDIVGLGDVDNTSDLLKPISTATGVELNKKASYVNTFTALTLLSPTEGEVFVCVERANAEYIVQASGYTALAGDVTFANGLHGALQIKSPTLSGFFATLNDAVSRSRNIIATQDYTLSTIMQINCTTEDFKMDLGGHTLTSNNAGLISAFGGLLDEVAVTSHTLNTITVSASSALAIAITADIANRPIVKIVSDDAIDAAEDANERKGEHVRVKSIASGVLTLESDLYFTYTTAPRVAILTSKKFTLKNGALDVSDLATVRGTQVFCTKLIRPLIDLIEIKKGNDAGIVLRSCYQSLIENPSIHNLKDDSGAGYFGYGIDDSSSHATLVNGGDFSNTRHAYTTNTGQITAGGNMASFGANMYGKVVDSFCTGNSDDAFDTHPNAYFTTFENVTGYRNSKGLVKDRGKFTTVSLESEGDGFGIRTATKSDNMTIKSIVTNGTDYPLFLTTDVASNVKILSSDINVTTLNECCRLTNTNLSGAVNVSYAGSTTDTNVFRMTNSNVNLRNLDVDTSDSSVAAIRVFGLIDATNSINVKNLSIKSDTANTVITTVSDFSGGTTNIVKIPDSKTDNRSGLSATTYAAGSYLINRWDTGDSSSFFVTLTASDQGIPELIYNGAPRIALTCTVTGSSKNLIALPDGVFIGQQLQITLSKNSAFNVTIRDGATYNTDLSGSANVTLSQSESLSLFWNATAWEEFIQSN
jgi:hypothetical protein